MSVSLFTKISDHLPIGVVRFIFNYWPPFRGANIKVTHISPDYRSFEVSLKFGLFNKNLAGVHFGGSLFAMVDPFYMVMYIKNLGKNYIVWDKAAKIDFKKPGKGTIKAVCAITEDDITAVKEQVDTLGKIVFDRTVDLLNEQNEIVATVIKTLYIKKIS